MSVNKEATQRAQRRTVVRKGEDLTWMSFQEALNTAVEKSKKVDITPKRQERVDVAEIERIREYVKEQTEKYLNTPQGINRFLAEGPKEKKRA